jgi:hypothetical protein
VAEQTMASAEIDILNALMVGSSGGGTVLSINRQREGDLSGVRMWIIYLLQISMR